MSVSLGSTGITFPDATTQTTAAGAGGVTSLNGQTGAITNTSLYAIGSYIIGRPANTSGYASNATIAGSSLSATPSGAIYGTYFQPRGGDGTNINSSCPNVGTGTWRCVAPAPSINGEGLTGLWVRIS